MASFNIGIQANTARATTGIRKLNSTVSRLETEIAGLGTSLGNIEKHFRKTGAASDSFNKSLSSLGTSVAIGATIALGNQLVKLADTYSLLSARVQVVTASTDSYATVLDELLAVSNENLQPLEATASLYTKVARGQKELGASTRDLVNFTDSLQKTLRISGASAEESFSVILQVGQALASGRFQGDELRSFLENNAVGARILADAMDVPVGALKDLGSQGKISAKVFLDAFVGASDEIKAQYEQLPRTVEGAFNTLNNSLLVSAGRFDQLTGLTQALSSGIEGLSKSIIEFTGDTESMNKLLDYTALALVALGGAAFGKFIAAAYAAYKSVRALRTGLTLAAVAARGFTIALGPIGLAITAASVAFSFFGDSLATTMGITREYTDENGKLKESVENLTKAQANQALLENAAKQEEIKKSTRELREEIEELEALNRRFVPASGNDVRDKKRIQDIEKLKEEIVKLEEAYKNLGESNDAITKHLEDMSVQLSNLTAQTLPQFATAIGRAAVETERFALRATKLDAANKILDSMVPEPVKIAQRAEAAIQTIQSVLNSNPVLSDEKRKQFLDLIDRIAAQADEKLAKLEFDKLKKQLDAANALFDSQFGESISIVEDFLPPEEAIRREADLKLAELQKSVDAASDDILAKPFLETMSRVKEQLEKDLLDLNFGESKSIIQEMLPPEAVIQQELDKKLKILQDAYKKAENADDRAILIKGIIEARNQAHQEFHELELQRIEDRRQAELTAHTQQLEALYASNTIAGGAQAAMLEMIKTNEQAFSQFGAKMVGYMDQLTSGIGDAAAEAIVMGGSFSQAIKSVAKTIVSDLVSSLIKLGLQQAILGTVTTAVTSSAGATAAAAWLPAALYASVATLGTASATGSAALAGALAAATGASAASSAGNIPFSGANIPGANQFANGGIVNSPTFFATGGSGGGRQANVMGEAGPEAIMPVTKVGGKYGVSAAGVGGTVVNISNNASGVEIERSQRSMGTDEIIEIAVNRSRDAIRQDFASDLSVDQGEYADSINRNFQMNRKF